MRKDIQTAPNPSLNRVSLDLEFPDNTQKYPAELRILRAIYFHADPAPARLLHSCMDSCRFFFEHQRELLGIFRLKAIGDIYHIAL